ncbi:hypothetical protein OJF2_72400 [Aquisphaera giovannonii]|uniref:Uncharacterized protein n=1 Tax=Aquisphaera giovannonii TaxID=406548 RepID=A0A5B9WEJ5_9BACT|nr:hypothetical protein [Aquisphaera giovannonii]QEH38634.1 hypothetical protein OJF2_72400 [Aquisphaera giovannonii]
MSRRFVFEGGYAPDALERRLSMSGLVSHAFDRKPAPDDDPAPRPEPDPGPLPTAEPPIIIPPLPPSGPAGPG